MTEEAGWPRPPLEQLPSLHRPPTRPVVDHTGLLANPLNNKPFRLLDDATPLDYEELFPDTTYVSPGFEYLTDERGLPARVRGALRLAPKAQRVRHSVVQAAVGRTSTSSAGDNSQAVFQGGHIVAVSLGGYASGPNLFPQEHNFNISAYARLEHGWRRALADGVTVEVDIALTLDADPLVPQFVVVTYWEDGEEWEHVLLNESSAQ